MSQILQDNKYELKYGNDLLKDITIQNMIGQGNCVVYEVTHNTTNTTMALKEIIMQSQEEEQYIKEEQQMLKFLSIEQKNNYFIKYEDFCIVKVIINDYIEHTVAYLLMEKATISLSSYVDLRNKKNIPFSTEEVIYITEECVNAFTCLQEYKIAHSDIKPENILLDFIPHTQMINNTLNYIPEKVFDEVLPLNDKKNNQIKAKSINLIQQQQQVINLEQKNQSMQMLQQKSVSQNIDQANDQQNTEEINPRMTLNHFTCKIKICDIGSAIRNSSSSEGNTVQIHQIEGTIPFLAPELFKKYIKKDITVLYNPYKSDVFSFGLCVLFLILQQRFYKHNRICMEESAYSEIVNEWIMYAKQVTNQNSLIATVLDQTLQIQYEKRPDFFQLNKLIKDSLPEEQLRRKKLREQMNLNSFQNIDFNEIESFSPIKFKNDRLAKNKSPRKNQSANIYAISNKPNIQNENSKKVELVQNYKKQSGRNTLDYINPIVEVDLKKQQSVTPSVKQQSIIVKETDLTISIFEKTGELHQINGKLGVFQTSRGKSASRAKSNMIKQQDKKNSNQIQSQNVNQNQRQLVNNQASENVKPNLLNKYEFKRKGSDQIHPYDSNRMVEQGKQMNMVKLPSIKSQQSTSAMQPSLPSLNSQSTHSALNNSNQGEINLLAPRKKTQDFEYKNQKSIGSILENNIQQQHKPVQINNQHQVLKTENSKFEQSKNQMRSTAYQLLHVETSRDQVKKLIAGGNNTNASNAQKAFQTTGMEKLKQQLLQKQNQNQKGKSDTSNQTIVNKNDNLNDRVQLVVISSLEQMKKDYAELTALSPSVRAKKYLKIILKDIPSAIQMLKLLKGLNDIKNLAVIFSFSLENVKIDPDSPYNFANNQGISPSSDVLTQNKQFNQQNTIQLQNQYSNDSSQANKISLMKTQSQMDKNTIQQKSKQETNIININNVSQRSSSRQKNRSFLAKRINPSKNKSFSNDNLDSSFSSSQGNSNKHNANDLSVSIIGEQFWRASEVFQVFMENLITLRQLDSLSIEFKNFMDQSTEQSFIDNLQAITKDQQIHLKECNITVTHQENDIRLLFDYIKLIIQNSQSTLKTLSLNLRGQLANQELKIRTIPLSQFLSNFRQYTSLETLQLNLAKNKLKKEFVVEMFELTKYIENLHELKVDFGYNQLSFPSFQLLSINPKLTNLDLNFENNCMQEGIPSIAKQLPNCKQLKQLKLNFRQNRCTSNDHIIFLLSCLKNAPLGVFNLNISDNSELDDQLFWKIQNLDDLSSWICSDLQFNIKNLQIGMPSLVSLLEYLKNHMRSFHSITCTILRRYSLEQIKNLIANYHFLDHYNFHIMKISQSHMQFTLSLKQFNDFSTNSQTLLKKSVPDVLCEFLSMNSGQKRMYRCLTCENSGDLKDYVQYDTSVWKYCKQCIYVCHRGHEFIELTSCIDDKAQCVCSFTHNFNCLLSNVKHDCTNQLGKHLFQQSYKCYDCSQSNQDVYVCGNCKDCCHKDHFIQFHSLRVFDCQCSKPH